MRRPWLLALLGVMSLWPSAAAAGDDPVPAPGAPQAAVRQTPDFLFSRPRAALTVRAGWLFRETGSDWFDFVTSQLTVDKNDFRAAQVAADVAIAASPRMDIVIGADWSSRAIPSEYRDFVDNNRLPINQTTTLRQTSITGGVRYALLPRGRSVGTLAWLPRRFVPYVGAGAGVLWYQLQQQGDFVDVADFSVFPDLFENQGWRPVVYGSSGVDIHVYRPLYINFDARYQWADADLEEPFIGFEALDLGGFRLSAGLSIVF
jgi:hypothetical protein